MPSILPLRDDEPEERRRGGKIIVPKGVRLDETAGPVVAKRQPVAVKAESVSAEAERVDAKAKLIDAGAVSADARAKAIAAEVESSKEREAEPIETLEPQVPSGGWRQVVELAKYMAGTEVHTYAFSVAANVILSLFPFIVLLLTITRQVFHSTVMEGVVGDMMRSFLPVGQDFIIRNMQILAHPRKGTQVFSLVMLLVTSTGVFLPLEVALNNVWGVTKNRNYLHNQAVSLGLAFAVGVLSMISVALSAGQQSVVGFLFFGHTDNVVFRFVAGSFLHIVGGMVSILLFFLIYWALPNRKVPARAVIPTAIVIGVTWEAAKFLYILALPWLDFQSVYGPFYISVGLMMWAFLSGLLLLAGAHFSATRYTLKLAREAQWEAQA